jgi:succinate dehydrogenase/fumarate reductase flavoprotein subunit
MPFNVTIAGAGIGGLCAARSAQEQGAHVLVLEKASQIGGSAAASGGMIWCARTIDEWEKVQPGGDRALGQALIGSFQEGIPWLRTQGLAVTPVDDRPYKFEREIYSLDPTPRACLQSLARTIEQNGGTIVCDAALRRIHTDNGILQGLTYGSKDHETRVDTSALVLATGGFQASPELRARYMGQWFDRIIVRGVPENTGDAFEAALEIGAQTTGPLDRFYGHYLPAPPAEIGLHNYVLVKPDFSEYAVAVNLGGQRYANEFLGDEVAIHSLIHQPDATGVLIFDDHIRQNQERYSQWPTTDIDRVKNIREAGGDVVEASTLGELANQISRKWSIPSDALLETLIEYNKACSTGSGADLDIPKSGGMVELTTPPYYAIRIMAGATFTYGGVKVNADAKVLDQSDNPIAGLYAAGADCGGVYTRGYTGGLCVGLAFGRIAGLGAAAYLRNLK